ncbi:MAG: tetratricopeptide repeat protein [Rhodospirillales bacterium]|nr:tetratricopeptide repeat protein [Rhodospirillales bacterium]
MLSAGVTAGQAKSLSDAAAQLAKRLESRPNDATGWFLLGRSYLTMQQFPEAVRAFARARQLAPEQPEYVGAYVEAAIAASGGRIDDNATEALQSLLALDPSSAKALFLLALGKAQRGDLAGAVQDWANLAATAPPDAPWLPTVREHLDRAASQAGIDPATVKPSADVGAPQATAPADARGPNAQDIAAADRMNPEERQRMIRGMVEGLAARLAEHPDDIDGWRKACSCLGGIRRTSESGRGSRSCRGVGAPLTTSPLARYGYRVSAPAVSV